MVKISQKKAFSLIEVVIAASILSVTVFGVYKLIGENAKLINNSGNYLQLNTLFPALEECIKSRGISAYTSTSNGDIINFDFDTNLNGCRDTGTSEVRIDNVDYYLEGRIVNNQSPEYIDWELRIEGDGVGTSTGTFKLIN